MNVYDVILKRHSGSTQKDVCIFYDEDKELAIKKMAEYDKKNGFTITEKEGRFSIATISRVKKKMLQIWQSKRCSSGLCTKWKKNVQTVHIR